MSRLPVFILCVVGMVLLPSLAAASLLTNGGFESVVPIEPLPVTEYDRWSGNPGDMVTTENGITPLEGQRMLKFLPGDPTTNIWQVIDVSALAPGTSLSYSAAFNRLDGSRSTVQMRVSALTEGLPATNSALSGGIFAMLVQDVPANTWTTLSIPFSLPPATVALGVEVAYFGNSSPGGYADNASLVPEPHSFSLAAVGLTMLIGVAWRRRLRVGKTA